MNSSELKLFIENSGMFIPLLNTESQVVCHERLTGTKYTVKLFYTSTSPKYMYFYSDETIGWINFDEILDDDTLQSEIKDFLLFNLDIFTTQSAHDGG